MKQVFSVLAVLFLTCGVSSAQSSATAFDSEWRSYGHDPGGMRFSPLKQINATNIQLLQRAWTYEIPATPNSGIDAFETTPLMVDGVLYLTTQTSHVIALDADTGKELWTFDPFPGNSGTRRPVPNRGAAYWQGQSSVPCGAHDPKFDQRLFTSSLWTRACSLSIPKRAVRAQALAMGGRLTFAWGWRTNGRSERTTQLRLPPFTKIWSSPDAGSRKSRRQGPVVMFAPSMSGPEN